MGRTLTAVGLVAVALLSVSCSRKATVESGPAVSTPEATARGTVRRLGSEAAVRTVVQGEESLVVVGDYESEIARAAGAEVWVSGTPVSSDYGPAIRVSEYRILSVDGEVPLVGIVVMVVSLVATVLLVFVGVMRLAGFVPVIFFPPNDRPTFTAEVQLPVGSNLESTDRVVAAVEDFMRREMLVDGAAAAAGGSVTETDDRATALEGAHVIYAKSWSSTAHYGDKLGDADLKDLAMFVSAGQIVMDDYIDRSSKKPKGGDAAKGAADG